MLDGSLGSPGADAALAEAAREALLRGTSRTVEIEGRSVFVEAFPVRPRLVVVGAVEVARSLVRIARELGYETVVIDGRESFATPERFPPELVDRLIVGWPDEVADEIGLGQDDSVAVLTHDVKFDEPAIVEALRRGCRYVGAVGSRKTQGDRRERLRAAGVTEDELARLRGPVGLDLGGRSPAETALAIMAEVVAARYGGSGRPMVEKAARLDTGRGRRGVRVAAVVLAAGAASRFGSPKALARLDGRPILEHVLDAVREAGIEEVVVVLGHHADEIEDGIDWLDEQRVRNPDPRHLSSSLQVGIAAVAAIEPPVRAAVIVLGDQPRTRPDVIRALMAAGRNGDRPVVIPHYAEGGGPNPLAPEGRRLRARRRGERRPRPRTRPRGRSGPRHRGPGRWIEPRHRHGRRPGPGSRAPRNRSATYREVMTTATAAELEVAWAERVRANREQVDQVREMPDRDFYAPVSSLFVADPRRTGEEALDVLLDADAAGRPLARHRRGRRAVRAAARRRWSPRSSRSSRRPPCATPFDPARRSTAWGISGSSRAPGRLRSRSSASRPSRTSP